MVIHSPCAELWMNCKACLRLSRRTGVEDTDGSSEESDDSWEWYEDREFDSLFFSAGQLRPRTEHPDAAADEPAPGFLERRSPLWYEIGSIG
mmetsp:Transcript_36366/g.103521  ORF Transcript_36366/g.103521 Transcript_36366/m.103521 type:complete len:92 (+) Transcript_36366:118-393(+)